MFYIDAVTYICRRSCAKPSLMSLLLLEAEGGAMILDSLTSSSVRTFNDPSQEAIQLLILETINVPSSLILTTCAEGIFGLDPYTS
jgi:hypothetical protein